MYLAYYGLREGPFTISPDPRFLYMSDAHREAFAHLTYGISQMRGFVVITGPVGTGKTTLVNALLADLPQKVRTAFLVNPALTRDEFYYLLADAYQLGAIENKAQFLVRFSRFLEKAYQEDDNVVLIVDEAHCLSRELLEEIRLLSNLETPRSKLMNIILLGQPELETILDEPRLLPLRQRITLHFRLPALTKEETRHYMQTRLLKGGARDLAIFDENAVSRIYDYTKGIPRLINVLADRALLTGYLKEKKRISDTEIDECADELSLKDGCRTDDKKRHVRPPSCKRFFPWFFFAILAVFIVGIVFFWWNNLDGFAKSPGLVMPDLIRHPEHIENTGFRPPPE